MNIKILLSILSLVFVINTKAQSVSIYNLKEDSVIGNSKVDFNNFRGKKILIVNIAINSPDTVQLRQLQKLHAAAHRRLVIIAFPSNSFGNTPQTNSQIAQWLFTKYNIKFPVVKKDDVSGNNMQRIYKWLTNKTENSMMDITIRGDYQKFLINDKGELIGVFDKSIQPLHELIINEINKIH